MCGIVASFQPGGGVDASGIARATKRLHHRGPDGQRTWCDERGRVGLGHARLSIIDLAGGDQPIANEDETIRVIVNGEFYGFEAIRAELEGKGHRFRTGSDSEIVLHLYEELGFECVHRLRGEFAFALWDRNKDLLFVARDRFGIKPLFFAEGPRGNISFASEAKALFELGFAAAWDEAALVGWTYGMLGQGASMFRGIRQVPAGHFVVCTKEQIRQTRYWDLSFSPVDEGSTADHVSRLTADLRESVALRLRADVPVGVYLSGGIDSSAILATAAQAGANALAAFTVCFSDTPSYNEERLARRVAAQFGANMHPISVSQATIAENLASAVVASELPVMQTHGVAKFILSQHVRRAGYKVVLTGEGSDEILGGYAHFRRDNLLYGTGHGSAENMALLEDLVGRSQIVQRTLPMQAAAARVASLDVVRARLGFVPSFVESFHQRGQRFASLFSPSIHPPSYEDYLSELSAPTVRDEEPVNTSMRLWMRTIFGTYLLNVLADRSEMGNSVEGRVPFLDHVLVEHVSRMPLSAKVEGLTGKVALRKAMTGTLDDEILAQEKRPFHAPPFVLDRSDGVRRLRTLIQDTLRGQTLRALPFFERDAVMKDLSLLDCVEDLNDADASALSERLMFTTTTCLIQEGLGF